MLEAQEWVTGTVPEVGPGSNRDEVGSRPIGLPHGEVLGWKDAAFKRQDLAVPSE